MADKTVRYTPEFKHQMVELVRSGRTPAELSREFGPTAWTISLWVRQDARDRGKGDGGLTTAEREDLTSLPSFVRAEIQASNEALTLASWSVPLGHNLRWLGAIEQRPMRQILPSRTAARRTPTIRLLWRGFRRGGHIAGDYWRYGARSGAMCTLGVNELHYVPAFVECVVRTAR